MSDRGSGPCAICGKSLQPVGRARKNGKAHADWGSRNTHKSCWAKQQRDEEAKRQRGEDAQHDTDARHRASAIVSSSRHPADAGPFHLQSGALRRVMMFGNKEVDDEEAVGKQKIASC